MHERTRVCKDCKITIPYIARKVRCVECYKKITKWTKPIEEVVQFIKEVD